MQKLPICCNFWFYLLVEHFVTKIKLVAAIFVAFLGKKTSFLGSAIASEWQYVLCEHAPTNFYSAVCFATPAKKEWMFTKLIDKTDANDNDNKVHFIPQLITFAKFKVTLTYKLCHFSIDGDNQVNR